jgi:hypothetical protein
MLPTPAPQARLPLCCSALGTCPIRSRVLDADVIRQGVRLVATGLAIGLPLSLGVAFLVSSFLFAVAPTDVATYAAVASILLGGGDRRHLPPRLPRDAYRTRCRPAGRVRPPGGSSFLSARHPRTGATARRFLWRSERAPLDAEVTRFAVRIFAGANQNESLAISCQGFGLSSSWLGDHLAAAVGRACYN